VISTALATILAISSHACLASASVSKVKYTTPRLRSSATLKPLVRARVATA
jgi:hypothetical protein